jgi:glycerophosphoryl diester phosphodiesterase
LRALHLRGNDGAPIADHVMLLEDLCALLADNPPHPEAVLQLDYKEDQGPLDDTALASFARSVGPVAGHMILSSGEAESVDRLTGAAPGIRIGYDPCHGDSVRRLMQSNDFAMFVDETLTASPQAEMVYLAYQLVLAAADSGFDIVAALHAAGRRVDAYTLKQADAPGRDLAERLLALRVDQITTDDPEGLSALLC